MDGKGASTTNREQTYAADEPPEPELLEPEPLDEEPVDASLFLAELPFLLESLEPEPDFSLEPDFSEPLELLDPPSDDDEDDEPPESPLLVLEPALAPLLEADVLGSLPRESLR